MSDQRPIRILCVDDHHLVSDGLVLIINRRPDLTVVATAATGEQARRCSGSIARTARSWICDCRL
jgi:DNA-binding NarL/FixJ family response regulator